MQLDERFVLYFLWKNWAISHTMPDWPEVLSRGLLDIRDEARQREKEAPDEEQRAFYRALQVSVEGLYFSTNAKYSASSPNPPVT